MDGFFRILPTRPNEKLPASQRMRAFRFIALLNILYHVGTLIRNTADVIEYANMSSKPIQLQPILLTLNHFLAPMTNCICVFLILEIIEIVEANQTRISGSSRQPEQNEWSLPYVLFIALLSGLFLLQWVGISMTLDWKSYFSGLDPGILLFLCIWCVDDMRRLMNRQRAMAAASIARFPLTLWFLAIPLAYGWVSQFRENLLNEMIGIAIVAILIPVSYLRHGEGIYLFLNTQPFNEQVQILVTFSPLLWSLLMIYKANRFGIGSGLSTFSPLSRRLTLALGIALAFLWPSLPRWVFPRLSKIDDLRLIRATISQWFLIGAFATSIAMAAGLIPTIYISGNYTFRIWSFLTNLNFTTYLFRSFWFCGVLYELMLMMNTYRSSPETSIRQNEPSREPVRRAA